MVSEGEGRHMMRLYRAAVVWATTSVIGFVLVLVAKRVASVFAGQGAFPTSDLIGALPWPGVWAIVSLLALAPVVLAFARLRELARATRLATIACALLLLLFSVAFILAPYVQWVVWLRNGP